MTQSNVLIDRLSNVFGAPNQVDNIAAFIAEFRKLTDHFGVSVLNKAADYLIRNGGRGWPTPKACVEACIDAQESISAAEQAKPQPRNKPKLPWEIHAELACDWAVDFCKHSTLGKQAFDEGWGRVMFTYVQSWAREYYRTNTTPDRTAFTMPQEHIDYYRRYSRTPNSWVWLDRVALLGDDLYPAIKANREQYGPVERDSKPPLDFSKLWKTPLPPAVSQDQFEIDQQTGAA